MIQILDLLTSGEQGSLNLLYSNFKVVVTFIGGNPWCLFLTCLLISCLTRNIDREGPGHGEELRQPSRLHMT